MKSTKLSFQEAFLTVKNGLEIAVMTFGPALVAYLVGIPQSAEIGLGCGILAAIVAYGRAKGWNQKVADKAKSTAVKATGVFRK